MAKREKHLKHFSFLFMNHWGGFYFLPSLRMSIVYSQPMFTLIWLVFRIDYRCYKELPYWFMKYVWSIMNFDFLRKKEDEREAWYRDSNSGT